MKERDFGPFDPWPSWFTDALQQYAGSLGTCRVRIKPGAPTVLQVPAGPGADQVSAPVGDSFRWRTSTLEATGPGGAARLLDVWLTATVKASHFESGDLGPFEVDDTDRSFGLAITEVDTPPAAAAFMQRVAVAVWDGTRFTSVLPVLGGARDYSDGAGPVALRPSAASVSPGARWTDEFGTEWLSDGVSWLAVGGKMPYCELLAGPFAVPDFDEEGVEWTTEVADAWGMHTPGSPDVVFQPGVWSITRHTRWQANNVGDRISWLKDVWTPAAQILVVDAQRSQGAAPTTAALGHSGQTATSVHRFTAATTLSMGVCHTSTTSPLTLLEARLTATMLSS